MKETFPELWPAVDIALAVYGTLLLRDNANPAALILVGGPSSSKTTVAEMFGDHPLTYVSDNFTPAAFVSQAANRTEEQLQKVDPLPRIEHKLLVTPELAPIFRGKDDDLIRVFKIITRVLDGNGLKVDGGVQGRRGYRGDYMFAWLGCTTQIDDRALQLMAQLGSRLFFYVVDDDVAVTVDDLIASATQTPYTVRLAACRSAVHAFLTPLFECYGGVRGIEWDSGRDPEGVIAWIARLATVLSRMRSEPARDADSPGGYAPPNIEQPWRANAILRNIARGHALVHGRRCLDATDLPLVASIAVDTMPSEYRAVFRALVQSENEELVVAEARAALNARHAETARKAMRELDRRQIADFHEDGPGRPARLVIRPEWAWCTTPTFRALLAGDASLVTIEEVCASPVTPYLVQNQIEREGEGGEVGADAHSSSRVTGSAELLDEVAR